MATAEKADIKNTAHPKVASDGGPVVQHAGTAPADAATETIEYQRVEPETTAQTQTGGPPWGLISFLAIVIIPFLASLLYFAFIAEDQFTAEARFAVRSLADTEGEKIDVSLLSMKPASQDAYVVTSFIHSSEILDRIGKRIDYRSMFDRSGLDFIGTFGKQGSKEDFLDYWKKQVTSYIDGPSGIVTLRVTTFKPEDSILLANAILEESEKLINELSERSRSDMIAGALAEVERAGKTYGNSLAALNRFQKEANMISPQSTAMETGKLLTGLIAQKLEFDSRLFTMQQSGGMDSPTYRQLLVGRESLESQIEDLRGQLTGQKDESLANSLTEFSRLETDRMVAEKLYEVTRRHYEMSLAAAMRKALYLTVFVHPMLPEEALYPRRILSPLLILLGLIVLWSTLRLVWASVEDHML